MSGLGWPGRGRRGAHAAGGSSSTVGLGWPGRPEPADIDDLEPVAAEPSAADPAEQTTLPAVLPPELRTGDAAPVAPVVVPAAVEAVSIADPTPVALQPDPQPDPEPDAQPQPDPQPDPEPADRLRASLREDVADEQPEDLPIGAQAQAAVRALNPTGRHDFPRPAQRRIITIANQKGGVGKTTTTVNLAAALALHGAKVLVIDLDPQGNCSTGLGVEHRSGTPNVYDVLIDEAPIAEVVQPADGIANLWCVPATIDLAGAEIELVSVVARESRLKRAIEEHCEGPGKDLDYVLVDCPPSLGLLTVNAMVATREVLIPIQCEYYALEGLGQLLKNVELVKQHLNRGLHVSTILLTMYDARTRLADQVADEVRNHFGETVLRASIPRSVRVSEAPGYGQSVVTYDPGSRGSLAYIEAAREIAVRGAEATA
jgi:chromosome partitioning protein